MSVLENLEVKIIEKDLITVEFVEKDLIQVNLNVIDILRGTGQNMVVADSIMIEEPAKINSIRFQTSQEFITGTLKVFFNGIKERATFISIINSTTFELPIASTSLDIIEVEYVKANI